MITEKQIKRMTTKELKIRIDNLTLGLALGIIGSKSADETIDRIKNEKMEQMFTRQEMYEKEFYSRRNHKQYIKSN